MAPSFSISSQAQKFALPSSLIGTFCQNRNLSWLSIFKLYKTCKYFWSQMQVFRVNDFAIIDADRAATGFWDEKLDCRKLITSNHKIIAEGSFKIIISSDIYLVSSLVKRFWQCSLTVIFLTCQKLTLKEFKVLTSKAETLELYRVTIKDDNNAFVPIEILLADIPNLSRLSFDPGNSASEHYYTPNSAQQLAETIKLKDTGLLWIQFSNVPESFDANAYLNFIEANTSKGMRKSCIFDVTFNAPDDVPRLFLEAIKKHISQWSRDCLTNLDDISKNVSVFL